MGEEEDGRGGAWERGRDGKIRREEDGREGLK